VLLDLVRNEFPDVPAVFCDTGLEFPEIKDFVKTFANVVILRPEMSYKQVVKRYGYPLVSKETALKIEKLRHGHLSARYRNYLLNGDERGSLGKLSEKWKFLLDAPFDTSEKCCTVMKKKPMKKYMRETGRYPFMGTTQDESYMRQRQYEKTGCNVFDGSTVKSQPMGFWTRQDVLKYVVEHDLKIASVYGDIYEKDGVLYNTGEQRTGCIFCAFGAHLEKQPNRFQRLEKTHPQLYQYCMSKDGLNEAEVLKYCGIPYENETKLVGKGETAYCQCCMDLKGAK